MAITSRFIRDMEKAELRRPTSYPLACADAINDIERRYLAAREASDIGALAILAVEVFPSLIATARRGVEDGSS